LLPGLSEEATQSKAFRINQAGQIVGLAITGEGASHAALWQADAIVDIGVLEGGTNSFANDINDLGVVVGSSEGREGTGSHAFTWTAANGFVDYGNTDPPFRLAVAGFNGINNHGLLVGTIYIFGDPYHAARARPGDLQVTDISPPGRTSLGMAMAVNDAGTIVGYQNDGLGNPVAAIFFGPQDYQLLGSLGLDESYALDVNESGTIVGQALGFGEGTVSFSAFVYEDGEMADLYTLIPQNAGWESLIEATAINDRGWIVGEGIYEGRVRAFLAIPVPEPSVTGLAMIVTVWLTVQRKRSGKLRSSR
jgi:probable HAF family extracellular repeat protein